MRKNVFVLNFLLLFSLFFLQCIKLFCYCVYNYLTDLCYSLQNKKMNYRNKYIPQLSRDVGSNDCDLDLIDIFELQEVDKFVKTSTKYLNETKIINFAMINMEKEQLEKENINFDIIFRELKKLKVTAKTVDISDFDNYNENDKIIAYEGTLTWDKNNYRRKLQTQTRESMLALVMKH